LAVTVTAWLTASCFVILEFFGGPLVILGRFSQELTATDAGGQAVAEGSGLNANDLFGLRGLMAIFLHCPSCVHKIKVRDELAGRKVKCPECGKVIAVPAADEDEARRRKRPAAVEDDDEPPKRRSAVDEDADEGPPSKKKVKSLLSTDVNTLNNAFKNFDVTRFTIVGWLLFVIAVGLGFLAIFIVEANYERWFGPMEVRGGRSYYYWIPYAIAAAVSSLGTYFGLWGILHLAGVTVIRPKKKD
jgi:predicted Zn finger-like uncharacterized protein